MPTILFRNVISYIVIASIFITGAGYELSYFKFYWYYPFYLLFVLSGLLIYRKIDYRILLTLLAIILYTLLTYKSGLPLVIKQCTNIAFSWLVFYVFIHHERHDLIEIFRKYSKLAKVLATLGLIQVFLFLSDLGAIYLSAFPWLKEYHVSTRLQSLTQEPSYIAFTFAPVVFIGLNNLFYGQNLFFSKKWSIIFIACYLLTQSAIAYFGLLLMLFLIYFKRFTYLKLQLAGFALVGIFLVGWAAYHVLPGIQMRVDDTLTGLSSDFFQGDTYMQVNPSTYAILSNLYVTTFGFKENPLTGSGLGTYELIYDKYIPEKATNLDPSYRHLNRQDGASMAFRLLCETGLVGLFFFFLFVFTFKMKASTFLGLEFEKLWVINIGIFALIVLALLRNGNYTIHGKILFFFIYYYTSVQSRKLAYEKTPTLET